MLQNMAAVTRASLRDVVPRRTYWLILSIVAVVALWAAYAAMEPINHNDWVLTAQQLRYMLDGQDPYAGDLGVQAPDLAAYEVGDGFIAYSPWYAFYFGFAAYATSKFIIALTVTCWIVIILDSGHFPALLLILHPTFIMLWASANIDFLVNGIGLWLVFSDRRGWRWGAALMLLAIKPNVLIFLLVLEGLRVLWERDWQAIGTMIGMAAVSVALYPHWLTDVVPAYIDLSQGQAVPDEYALTDYPFSVFGAWGVLAALGVTAFILLWMGWRRRLTEWRTLAVLLSLVWTTYLNPYSFAVLLILFRKNPAWRVVMYLALSIIMLPIFFTQYHHYERYGTLLFLLLAVILTVRDAEQTEEAIAARRGQPLLPGVGMIKQWIV